ncbi:preprotein translocase subunit SecA [Propioniciclava sp. MC1595]|uniref:preprotein translocase subunit SecA n=1 Tax=Propioniciclava sp. MC1595 TaxID=2760308 RepID=UPI001662709E|nr:preprotein translocase subunit SecA [Propioniciclava sp. MC1595]MBB1495725.1 preprotein translocase subunit SecA [Propioniciclava sp. MC1595]QTE27653.1 preprotein translocase subunit SecA [Propioniciclava sp. MC1595]
MHLGEGRQVKRLEAIANQVNSIESEFEAMSDEELRGMTAEFRTRLEAGETLDDLLPEAFATVREASRRVLGKRHFDVQLMGGAALHQANIAEMKTGEGKTLTATLPSYLNALTGKGVHVVTVNDYLAKYQSEQMGRVHHFLGLETGVILQHMTPAERRVAYAADITYGTNNEFGFDYLRDNMALSLEDCVQRGHHYAIVDEVDSILVDEARTPLIISGPAEDNKQWYPVFARLAKRMIRDTHYEVDEKKKTISVMEPGIGLVEDRLGIDNLYESANTPLISYLNNAIKAKELFARDKDYMVTGDGEVVIVDEFTGRTLAGRRYSEGLHQALEAKEGVEIKEEFQTLATITLQNYFRMYDKLAGMTGTAKTEESEFQKIYGLGVLPIATNRPMVRVDQADLIYRTEDAKFNAVVADVVQRHEAGQPVLLGTASVAKSELLSKRLVRAGVPHEVLNAKNHAREAAIVALAGRKGAVTVATNMAGRGTDIILGGNAEFLTDAMLREKGLDPVEGPEEYEAAWAELYPQVEAQCDAEHAEVVELGGLYVVGSERHESRRIDNQLRGRSGRQGDPGESRFYLSLQDDLMRLFQADLIERVLLALNVPDDVPIENKQVTNSVAKAQEMVESQNFEMRKNVLKYDDVMNRQRHTIYGDRRRVLEGADLDSRLRDATGKVVEQVVRNHTEGFAEDWDLDSLWSQLRTLYPVGLDQADYEDGSATADQLVEDFLADADRAYDAREQQLTAPIMREVERRVVLSVLDRKWREHLYEMDYLREGIGLRAMAQRDPLIEYQREGGDMFNAMMDAFLEESIGFVFNLEVNVTPQQAAPQVGVVRDAEGAAVDVAGAARQLTYSGPEEGGGVEVHTEDETGAEVATDDAEAVQPPVPPQNRKQRRSNKKRR